MEPGTTLVFVFFASLLVISPGPNLFLIAKTVPTFGYKAGLLNVLGFVAAFYIHGNLAIFGLSILLLQSAKVYFAFKMLGAMYLFWLGIKAIVNAFSQGHVLSTRASAARGKSLSLGQAFFEGLLTNMLNPKVSMFYLAALPQFISAQDNVVGAYFLVTAHALVNVLWFSAVVFLFARVKKAINNPKFKAWLNSVTGAALIGFAAKLALSKNHG